PGRLVYDLLYRVGVARRSRGWDKGVGPELRALVQSRLTPSNLGGNRAIDLGCGTGANSIFLAEHGFTVTGVDFSRVAVERAKADADAAGLADRARTLVADVPAERTEGADGPFDL